MNKNTKIRFGFILTLVPIIPLFIWLLLYERHWDGIQPWTFSIDVRDEITLDPIPRAIVQIYVENEYAFGEIEAFYVEEPYKKIITDDYGKCDLSATFNAYGTDAFMKKERYISFLHRNIRVDAPGYKTYAAPLKEHIETPLPLGWSNPYVGNNAPIKILMEKGNET
jgi:hypothetical protein